MTGRLIALHGFAGLASDWEPFAESFKGWPVHKLNLFARKPQPFQQWADDMASKLASFDGHQVLLGYSLGGRLAAHLLTQAPQLFSGAIFVSTQPGLRSDEERAARRAADLAWAEKWASLPWAELQREWNSQSVFQSTHSKQPARNAADFDRSILAESLSVWSLGEQADLRSALVQTQVKQLWLAGATDHKFVKLGEEMAGFSNRIQFKTIPRAGHRVPWDNPTEFTANVVSFLESL